MSTFRQMSFKLNLKTANRSSGPSSPRDSSSRPWEMTSPRRDSDPQSPRAPNSPRSLHSPRLVNPERRSVSMRAQRTPRSDFDALNRMKEKKTYILLQGSLGDVEAARRAIAGIYSSEDLAMCGARKIAFGGDTEKYDIPSDYSSVYSFTVLEVPQDAFRKTSSEDIRAIDINPL